ncbi:hypothetical protein P153DRAFT_411814 [Dothidotthia symphoricarpi CBS 119687]|uniref:Uncharacterized protein n=1 Tax=Dothidotthia symphoricarpi CBS 119687 TaxID=1392245 RepID=A0A6A5ZY44_9PLEO|nr:uncharacterized protein P153DRAFT_411814 [Dothidotthia symphoricarpi CBS 119687]KAF2124206.1 hypothetical protein P153DRAFT_411814 [Dothidotthia symphoricarpi CBS 119687]
MTGRTATTHHLCFDKLKQTANHAACSDAKIEINQKRWVDVGTTNAGVRIVNAANVTSRIDTSLCIYEQLVGKKDAYLVAEIAEFERRDECWSAWKRYVYANGHGA